MANQIQQVIYEGYLGKAPESRYTPSGKLVCNFSVASNHMYKTADGTEVKETTWLRVTAWGSLGEIVNKYATTGAHVIVIGRLKPDENGRPKIFEGQSGAVASYDVVADIVRILPDSPRVESSPESNEDVPF